MGDKEPIAGVYPGTFDPITKGHMDIVSRAAHVLDRLVIAVARNAGKGPLFSCEERVEMVRAEVTRLAPNRATIEVRPFDSLVIHLCQELGATVLVRGLRAVSDFEYEFQMAAMNARQDSTIETVFFMASERHQFISSQFVRELARYGGDISSLVSDEVRARLEARFAEGAGDAD